MAYAGVGLASSPSSGPGFVLMAEGAEGEGRRGRARTPCHGDCRLVVVLLAKA